MGAAGNGNNQPEWEVNGNKTGLNLVLGLGMGINHREWKGMRLKKTFPLISSGVPHPLSDYTMGLEYSGAFLQCSEEKTLYNLSIVINIRTQVLFSVEEIWLRHYYW